jgi:hypothetical protein
MTSAIRRTRVNRSIRTKLRGPQSFAKATGASSPNAYGLFVTLRQSVLAHSGEALASRKQFQTLKSYDQDSLIEFLKTLQVLPPGTPFLVVDENFHEKRWPPLALISQEKK